MSRILLLSVVLASLSSVVGCGASRASQSSVTTPTSGSAPEARDEECWHPPGEVALSINDAKAPEANAATTAGAEKVKSSSYRPNRQDRPTSGAVHAATY